MRWRGWAQLAHRRDGVLGRVYVGASASDGITPANEHDWAQVAALAHHMQEVTGDKVEVTFVD